MFASCEAMVYRTIVDSGNVGIDKEVGSVAVGESQIRRGHLIVRDNVIPAGEVLLVISGSLGLPVAKSIDVSRNTGDGDKFVSGVVSGSQIRCNDNTAPFSTLAPAEGGTNTAPKLRDQCS
jgi:hypothetical protein